MVVKGYIDREVEESLRRVTDAQLVAAHGAWRLGARNDCDRAV